VSPYHEHEEISNEQIKQWYEKACFNKFNVFDDCNKIILQLCRTIMKERKVNDDK
jgi:hypothetical protein